MNTEDTNKLIQAAELSSNGHHYRASCLYQTLANHPRKPDQKKQLWKLAEQSRKRGD